MDEKSTVNSKLEEKDGIIQLQALSWSKTRPASQLIVGNHEHFLDHADVHPAHDFERLSPSHLRISRERSLKCVRLFKYI